MANKITKFDITQIEVFDEAGSERYLNEYSEAAEISDIDSDLIAQEYGYVSEFGDTAKKVTQNIDAFLKAAGKNSPKYPARLLALWQKYKKGPVKKAKKKPLPPPEQLKGKPFDLSAETIELNGKEFAIPTKVASGSTKEMPDIESFGDLDWIAIAKRTGLVYGLDLDKVFSPNRDDYDDAMARYPALDWVVPATNARYRTLNLSSSMISLVNYSESTKTTVHNQIIGGSVSVSAPFASAAVEAEKEEKTARGGGSSKMHMTGVWTQPMARLDLVSCTQASKPFTNSVKDALEKKDDETNDKLGRFHALEKVFEKFGHVASSSVTLGGMMLMQSTKTVDQTKTEDEEKETIKAALNIKAGGYAGGGAYSNQDGTDTKTAAQQMAESAEWQCRGGDRTKVQDAMAWAETVKDVNSWALVERQGVRSLVDWLDKETRDKVNAVWNDGLVHTWGRTPPAGYMYPKFRNRPIIVKTEPGDTGYAVRSNESKLGTPDKPASKLTYQARWNSIPQSEKENYYWTLVYSGLTDSLVQGDPSELDPETHLPKGKPLYWIASYTNEELQRKLRFGENLSNAEAKRTCLLSSGHWGGSSPSSLLEVQSITAGFFHRSHEKERFYMNYLWTVEAEDPNASGDVPYRVRSLMGKYISADHNLSGVGGIKLLNDSDVDGQSLIHLVPI